MTDTTNPYAAPSTTESIQETASIQLEPKDRKKVDAVIKDAGQFWLAIILCFLCSALGALIIPIWYTVRLVQWTSLSKKYPQLVSPDAPPYSLPAKFKAAQWKLIVGMVAGGAVFAFVVLYLLVLLTTPLAA